MVEMVHFMNILSSHPASINGEYCPTDICASLTGQKYNNLIQPKLALRLPSIQDSSSKKKGKLTPLKSSAFPHLPAGILSLILLSLFSSLSKASFISVAMYPGAIALTVIPFAAHSLLKALVSWVTAPFDAAYAGTVRPPWKDRRDPKLIIVPFRVCLEEVESICAPTSRQIVNVAFRFTCKTFPAVVRSPAHKKLCSCPR